MRNYHEFMTHCHCYEFFDPQFFISKSYDPWMFGTPHFLGKWQPKTKVRAVIPKRALCNVNFTTNIDAIQQEK